MIKKITYSIFACMAGFIFINAINKTSGGHPSSTGAPGEGGCNRSGCHSDASVTKDSPVNSLFFSNPANTYALNGEYGMAVEVKVPGIKKFGFEIVALDSATKKNVGTWVITEPERTHLLDGESPNPTRRYVTHSAEGTPALETGRNKWHFKWKAPDTNKGTIIFYYATNASNMNDESSGDKLYLSNYKIRFAAGSIGIKQPEIVKPSLKINANSITLFAEQQTIQSLKIYNLEGKLVYENKSLKNGDTIQKEELSTSGHSVLVYHLVTDKGSYSGKVRM